jgi:ribosomal-protein-alanine N-acetyltransferase
MLGEMVVAPIEATDREAVQQIAQLTGSEFEIGAELERSNARIWVARPDAGGVPAAFLLAWQAADELHVMHLGTRPEWRRRGAAKLLLDQVLTHARSGGTRLVLLEVRCSNEPAISLYRSRGFETSRVRPNYYADTSEDALEMMLALDSYGGRAAVRERP